jgi:hypothetical protein
VVGGTLLAIGYFESFRDLDDVTQTDETLARDAAKDNDAFAKQYRHIDEVYRNCLRR